MDNLRTAVSQLYRLEVIEFGYKNRVFHQTRVSVQYTGNVFPDGHTLRIEEIGNQCGSIIRAFAPQGRTMTGSRPADKSLCDNHLRAVRVVPCVLHSLCGSLLVDYSLAERAVSNQQVRHVPKLRRHTALIEVRCHDSGGHQFADGYNGVIQVIVHGIGSVAMRENTTEYIIRHYLLELHAQRGCYTLVIRQQVFPLAVHSPLVALDDSFHDALQSIGGLTHSGNDHHEFVRRLTDD